MQGLTDLLGTISGYVWGTPLLVLLVGTGIYLTVRLRFIQFRHLGLGLKIAFGIDREQNAPGDISHFSALMTALAATIGTGNIAGVATAIAAGGPGALFWMWVTALVGMATKYAEGILAVKYRVVDENGEMAGGPMFYLDRGLGLKWLGTLFAIFGAIAAFGIGNLVQAHSAAEAMHSAFGAPTLATGLVLGGLTAAIILGGIKSIGRACGSIVPFMAFFYMLGAAIILVLNAAKIPGALVLIFESAFTGHAAMGGFLGAVVKDAIQKGVSRGVFSNESGLGSAPIAAAAARTNVPARQALVSMTGTFIDTIVICTMTGLVIVSTGAWTYLAGDKGLSGVPLTAHAFQSGMPGEWANKFVAIAVLLFTYSTIIGWNYYGEKCVEYLVGVKAIFPYRLIWIVAVVLGSQARLDLVWNFADIMNGLMAVPNLIALIGLAGVAAKETREFEASLKVR
ncbi:sodium:alanine symporter family protein [bacterium]|nr:sodium:alanine symporter family protein [bacterium]